MLSCMPFSSLPWESVVSCTTYFHSLFFNLFVSRPQPLPSHPSSSAFLIILTPSDHCSLPVTIRKCSCVPHRPSIQVTHSHQLHPIHFSPIFPTSRSAHDPPFSFPVGNRLWLHIALHPRLVGLEVAGVSDQFLFHLCVVRGDSVLHFC